MSPALPRPAHLEHARLLAGGAGPAAVDDAAVVAGRHFQAGLGTQRFAHLEQAGRGADSGAAHAQHAAQAICEGGEVCG